MKEKVELMLSKLKKIDGELPERIEPLQQTIPIIEMALQKFHHFENASGGKDDELKIGLKLSQIEQAITSREEIKHKNEAEANRESERERKQSLPADKRFALFLGHG
uniref:Uncharacterized protein n=1 Tax=Trieres chinensis TaxID=1514140 RepID=A0A7S1ZIB5_TRICV